MQRDKRTAILLIMPAVLLLAAIVIFPLLFTINVSLRAYDIRKPIEEYPFVGAANFLRVVNDKRFFSSLLLTAQYIGIGASLQLAIGLGLAVLLAFISWRRYVLPFIVIPVLTPPIVAGYMGMIIFHPDGPVNYLLSLLGLGSKILWYTSPQTALVTVALVDTWQWFPFMTLLILTGIISIDRSIIESARIDGAGSILLFRHITLPLTRPVIAVALLFRMLDMLRVFDVIYIMTFGGPGSSTEVINFYAYLVGFRYWDLGYSAAIGWVMVIILTIGVTLYLRKLRVR